MGLDMYAYRCNADDVGKAVDFEHPDLSEEIAYWRKHPNLHGWMEELYYQKGGAADSFNCVCVELTKEDLEHLRTDIEESNLPSTSGFFFGESNGEEFQYDLEFVTRALECIRKGDAVFYTSWW